MDKPGTAAQTAFERVLVTNGPVKLDISTHSGVVRIAGDHTRSVTIRGIIRGRRPMFAFGSAEEHVQQLARNPPIEQNGNTVSVGDPSNSWLPFGVTMLLDITVPRDTSVRARTSSGDVRVGGIAGPVECESDSGSIEISGVESNVRVAADSGRVRVAEVRGTVHAATDSGEIAVTQSIAAPVHVETDSGSVTIRVARGAGYNVRVQTDSGRIRVPDMTYTRESSPQTAEGQILGGGPTLQVSTDSGSVDVISTVTSG